MTHNDLLELLEEVGNALPREDQDALIDLSVSDPVSMELLQIVAYGLGQVRRRLPRELVERHLRIQLDVMDATREAIS